MSKQLLLSAFFLFFLAGLRLQAQVAPPCPVPPPPGAESCNAACVYCNFDGYEGTNNGTPSGGNTVCGQIAIHNDQWFGFVAGTTSITIDILTSNCQNGDGLQSAFFENCQDDAIVCNPGTGGGAGIPLTLTYSNFVPGQTYFLMLDGWSGDVCDFEIDVVDGSIEPPPPGPATAPQGPLVVCPGATVVYTAPAVDNAGYYRWTSPAGSSINGGTNSANIPAPDGEQVTITFGNSGGQICVQVGNACFPPTQACITVVNQPIPPTQKPPIIVCYEDRPYTWDEAPYTTFDNPGTYNLTSTPYDSWLSCDSVVKQTVTIKPLIKTSLGTKYLCPGECFTVNGVEYCDGGVYTEFATSFQGCDSLLEFTLIEIPAEAVIQPPTEITCNNPVVNLTSSGSSFGLFQWTNANYTVIGNNTSQNVTAGGTYHLIVSATQGGKTCRDTATVVVPANNTPPGVTAVGGVIGCLATNQSVNLQAQTSATGVNFQWSGPGINVTNQFLQNPTVSTPGTYSVTVSNPTNGCTSLGTTTVVADNNPPVVSAVGGTITCAQPTIIIDGISSVNNSSFNWAGPGINAGNQTLQDPPVTVSGNYTVTVTSNINGCTSTTSTSVAVNQTAPVAEAGPAQTLTCAVLNVTLSGSGTAGGSPVQYTWAGPGINAGNINQQNPLVNAQGTYTLTVLNTSNGCTHTDSVAVAQDVVAPVASAGPDITITCASPSVTLDGTASSQGTNFNVSWSGADINGTNQTLYQPQVGQPDTYTVTVLNTQNGCTSTDNVVVGVNLAVPVANAGTDQILTCTSTNGVTLSGSGTPANVTFLWSGPGIGVNNETLANPTVTQDGTYTLEVTDPVNGCKNTDEVLVAQDANVPTADAGPDLVLNCTVNSVNINAGGSSTGANFTYNWSGPGITAGVNDTDQNPSNISLPGSYQLTVTNTANNCVNTDIIVVTIDTVAPTANAGIDLILNCFNNAQDTLDASGSSAGANFTYNWTGPDITPGNASSVRPVVTQPGNYSLLVINTDNNCVATDQVSVNIDVVAPVANAGADQIIDCVVTSTAIGGNSSTGANFTYSWTGPAINATNQNQLSPVVDIEGDYNIVVTNNINGCTSTDDVVVTLNAVYPAASAGADLIANCTTPSVALDGAGSSNGANFQVTWSGPGITPANQNQVSPVVSAEGVYIIEVVNTANSCTTYDTVTVTEDKTTPAASAGIDKRLDCQILSVILDGSQSASGANISYLWSGAGIDATNESQQSPSVNQTDTYTLLVTNNDNGCTSTDEVFVDQDITLPIASAGVDITLTCAVAVNALDGTGSSAGPNFTYIWTGPGINSSNFNQQNPMVGDSGTYQIIVTDISNSCSTTDDVYVALNGEFPISNAGNDVVITCAQPTVVLDGSQSDAGAGITYLWSGDGITPGNQSLINPSVGVTGLYQLVVTNTNNGCSKTDFVNVTEDIIPPISNAGPDQVLTCTSTGVTLSSAGSSAGANFTLEWSGPGIDATNMNNPSPFVSVDGIYVVEITNTLNGCTSTDTSLVDKDVNVPTASAGPDLVIDCNNPQVSLDATGSTAGATIQITWTGPGINANNQSQLEPVISQAGTYSVAVLNTQTGCQSADNVIVTEDLAKPQLATVTDTITCTNPKASISVSSSLSGSTFFWTGPCITPANQLIQSPEVSCEGSYSVTVTAPNGCSSSANLIVYNDGSLPQGAAEGTTLNCINNGQGSISGTIQTTGATGQWQLPNGAVFSNDPSPVVTQAGTYIFVITAPNGCENTYEVIVDEDDTPPVAVLSVDEQIDCNTPSVSINGNGSSVGPIYTYEWLTSTGNFVSGTNSLNPVVNRAGDYTIVITNNINGCTATASVEVENDPEVPTGFDLSVRDILCAGDKNGSITIDGIFGGTEPFFYSLNGAPSTVTSQFANLTAGEYSISLEDANGCLLDTIITISEPSALQVDLGDESVVIQLSDSVNIAAQLSYSTPLQSITWTPASPCDSIDCLEFSLKPLQSYIQTITVIDENGCVATDKILVQVRKDRLVYVPNIFNPESDDPANAQLMIHGGKGVAKVRTWQIFDRWGSSVFEVQNVLPNDPTGAWNGTVKGEKATPAVFAWYAEIEFEDGVVEIYRGDVAVIRN